MGAVYRFLRRIGIGSRPCRETWRAGDLGMCIDDRWDPGHVSAPRKDELVRVVCVIPWRRGEIYLHLVGKPRHIQYEANGFRKIVPNHDAADAEFTATIRRPAIAPIQPEEASHG